MRVVAVLLCFGGTIRAEWLNFNSGCSDGTEPVINYGRTTESYITFDVELRGLSSESILHSQETYCRYSKTPGVRMLSEEGFPELPVVTCFVAIPDDVSLSIASNRSCADFLENVNVYPAPSLELVSESGVTFYKEVFQKNAGAYTSSEWFPEAAAEISGEFRLRDQRIAVIDVYPVQYLASEDSLRVWSDIGVFLEFSASAPILSTSDLGPYERLVGDRIIGYTPAPQPIGIPSSGSVYRPTDLKVAPPEIPDYVIVTAGGLDGSWIDDLANHRAQLNGFDVLIARGDDILSQFRTNEVVLTPDLIRDYLETLWGFGSPGNRPSYLLLIGDHEDGSCTTIGPWFLPTFVDDDWGFGNDEWFAYFGESRLVSSAFPDMIVGRLSVRDKDNLQEMIDLIREYEEPVTDHGSASLQYRRYLTRLSGTEYGTGDGWSPSASWTEALKTWLGYQWDNYYCGDGENTCDDFPPNPDGSSMTSADWKAACNLVFNRGSQVAFYVDHGDFHMFSAGLNWGPPAPDNFGVPDSTFNDDDVVALGTFEDHWHPFIMMLCCTAGTFNHTQYEHQTINVYPCLCYEPTDGLPPYDFKSDCLAEDFIRNTTGGAIGVYASSTSSGIKYYGQIGKGILESIYYSGITRQGDAIAAGRLSCLFSFWDGNSFCKDLGQFNLLGDPAVDLGDRVKYRNMCDLIISPNDLERNIYSTNPVAGSSGVIEFSVTVRNAGAVASGSFDVDLSVMWNETTYLLTETCAGGLSAGEEQELHFRWGIPAGFEDNERVELTAEADPNGTCQDSWLPNNSASYSLSILDTYPNENNWPVQLPSSVKCPPLLADLDGDGDLEIVAISGIDIMAFSPETGETIWSTGPYSFTKGDGLGGFTVAASGDICGDSGNEIVVDTVEELIVLSGADGSVLYSFEHGLQKGNLLRGPHGVTLADVFPEKGKLEIAFISPEETSDPPSLFVLTVDRGTLLVLDQEVLPQSSSAAYSREWITAANINADSSDELMLLYSWHKSGLGYRSGIWIYDHVDFSQQSGFTDSYEQPETAHTAGIHAIGDIAGAADQIALSRQRTGSNGQAWVFDADDLSSHLTCSQPSNPSSYIQCCVLADWRSDVTGLDRIIAPAENQCMAWNEQRALLPGWNITYGLPASCRVVPMPALANLVSESGFQISEVIVGTKDGWVNAFDAIHEAVYSLGFPYQLPSEIVGGFVAADVDLDGKLELVFGTMDNYLHVWELGSCPVGYAPWPQTQHDARRTGALLEQERQ